MSEKEIQQQMDAMRALDEPMPQVGIFWFDPNDHTFFGVRKQELTPKQVEEFAAKGIRTIDIKRSLLMKSNLLALALYGRAGRGSFS